MSCLYLCEKPSQARDIARVLGARQKGDGCLLGDATVVTWCYGHLLELVPPDGYDPRFKRWSLATLPIVPTEWRMTVTARGSAQFKIVQTLLREASEVIIATDADREGELIAREVMTLARWHGPVQRLWLSALDDASIRKALGALLPGIKTEPLWQAALGRTRADWLVGMNLTRAYTLVGQSAGYEGVLSVGRVQTPTLALIVDRDRTIEAFVPVAYFEVMGLFLLAKCADRFRARWVPPEAVADTEGRCLQRAVAAEVVQRVSGATGCVTKAETRRVKECPPLPFALSTLQQTASLRWGMGAQLVLDTAQSLYETHKATTYPRTDCSFLPESQHKEVAAVLAMLKTSDPGFAVLVQQANPALRSRAWEDAKITAHHAIIPTNARVDVARMNVNETRLYDLIRRRYLAQFYPDYEYDHTEVEVEVKETPFRTTGRMMRVLGWRTVLGGEAPGEEEEAVLPPMAIGDAVTLLEATLSDKKTRPPARYTEGTLIAAMKNVGRTVADPALKKVLKETSGIGTEATRAGILETLLKRGFLVREKQRTLLSTSAGRALVDALPDAVKSPTTTALWEQGLDEIARGEASLGSFLERQTRWVGEMVATVKSGQVPMGLLGKQAVAASMPVAQTPLRKQTDPEPVASPKRTRRAAQAPNPTSMEANPADATPRKRTRRTAAASTDADAAVPRKRIRRAAQTPTPVEANSAPPVPHKRTRRATEPPVPTLLITPAALPQTPTGDRCPQCQQGYLVQRMARQGPYAGEVFRGCSQFPRCRYMTTVLRGGTGSG